MDALDAGAADFQPEEGCFTVYTDPDDINTVAKALEDKGYKFDSGSKVHASNVPFGSA